MASPARTVPFWEADAPLSENVATNLRIVERAALLPEVTALLEEWKLEPPSDDPAERLQWLTGVAAEEWDFRNGRERNQVRNIEFSEGQRTAIAEASRALGLRDTDAPPRPQYDAVFVLGGLLRGCLTRWRTAHELVREGLTASAIVGLGGSRVLTEAEVEQGAALGITATTELEAMVEALRMTFSPDAIPTVDSHDNPELPNDSWMVLDFATSPRLNVVAAPSSDPASRRANTADTIEWWLDRSGAPDRQANLMITHQIYVPYQAAVAVRVLGLPRNTTVEFSGVTPAAGDLGPFTQHFLPHNYLQEIGSTLRGYWQLREALVAQAT